MGRSESVESPIIFVIDSNNEYGVYDEEAKNKMGNHIIEVQEATILVRESISISVSIKVGEGLWRITPHPIYQLLKM